MFLRDCWYVAATLDEIDSGPLARRILDEPVVLFRDQENKAAALEDICAHRRVPLSKGRVTPNGLQCPYHGFTYDRMGACTVAPGNIRVPPRAKVKSYPLCERYGWLWIWMGATDNADPALIPDVLAPYFSGEWAHARGYHHVAANYELISDNLLDLSHVDFVHAGSLGAVEPRKAEVWTRVEKDVVFMDRVSRDDPPAPFIRPLLPTDGNVDCWAKMRWQPPCVMILRVGACPPSADFEREGVYMVNLDLLTPETPSSTHYFWTLSRSFALGDDDLTTTLQRTTKEAFDQDQEILEHQQQNIGNADLRDFHLAASREDEAGMRARSILRRLLASTSTQEAC